MKLAEFNALCDREWAKTDRGGRGDVVLLTLTGPGAAELTADVLGDRSAAFIPLPPHIAPEEAAEFRAGASLGGLVNPVTRTPVTIRTRQGGKRETARVRVPGGYRQTWCGCERVTRPPRPAHIPMLDAPFGQNVSPDPQPARLHLMRAGLPRRQLALTSGEAAGTQVSASRH